MEIDELIELVNVHGKSIYGFCFKLTGNKEETDELYQETFLKAVEQRHKLDASRNPKALLLSIAIRLHQNRRRKLARRNRIAAVAQLDETASEYVLHADEESPEESLLSNELRTMIQNAVERLDDKLRFPLYMYYTAGMTVEEIASALNIPPGTVKSRLHKARETLKRTLEVDPL